MTFERDSSFQFEMTESNTANHIVWCTHFDFILHWNLSKFKIHIVEILCTQKCTTGIASAQINVHCNISVEKVVYSLQME